MLSFVPILVMHAQMLWARPHYHLFPLVIPGAIVLAIRQRPRFDRLQPGSLAWGSALGVACWGLLALGVLFDSPLVGTISALGTLATAVYLIGGLSLLRLLAPAGAVLMLAIPLPRSIDTRLVTALQNGVSRWASATLDTLGVYHAMEGNVVDVGSARLLVDQACSGINSLFTLLFGALMYVLWEKLSAVRALCLMGVSLFWVMVGNMARIVTVVVLSVRTGIDASTGWTHWWLGLVAYALMLGLVASTDRLFAFTETVLGNIWAAIAPRRWSARRADQKEGEMVSSLAEANAARTRSGLKHRSPRGATRRALSAPPMAALPAPQAQAETGTLTLPEPEPREILEAPAKPEPRGQTVIEGIQRSWLGSWRAAAVFGVLLVPQMAMPSVRWSEVLVGNNVINKAFATLGASALPEQAEDFRRIGFTTIHREDNNSWGENSRTWGYAFGNRAVAVSLDYQFVGWHDLLLCYESGSDWKRTAQQNVSVRTGERPTLVVADFVNMEGRYGYLIFGLFDREGQPLIASGGEGLVNTLAHRLGRWTRGRGGFGREGITPTYQFQVFVEGDTPLTPLEKAKVRTFFEQNRARAQRLGFATKGDKS